jgi:hypothetical protein
MLFYFIEAVKGDYPEERIIPIGCSLLKFFVEAVKEFYLEKNKSFRMITLFFFTKTKLLIKTENRDFDRFNLLLINQQLHYFQLDK